MSEMDIREIVVENLKQAAAEAGENFSLYAYKDKERFAKEFVVSVLLEINRPELFSELEVEMLCRAFLHHMEALQEWDGILRQEWRL